MNSSYNKYQASLAIEELYQQPHQHQQNWLLTYIDVFVLIIMLVITLMALNDLEDEQQNKYTASSKKPIKTSASLKNSSSTIVNEIVPILNEPSKQASKDLQSLTIETPPLEQQQPHAIEDTELPPIKKEHIIDLEEDNKKEKEYVEPNPIDQQQNQQPKEQTIQQQLNKTIEDLGLIDAVNMKVSLGYAQLEIQDNILFKSSDAILLNAGEALLKKLIPLLDQSSGLIYIEGHTDNRPIKTAKFPSNWELGAARATSVLHYLSSQKLVASRLRAITYGDTKPIADNASKQGREKNRRVSLVIKVSDKID
ncbi:MAG: flagellar motor protein MotB [Methylococcaceae bacterium]